MGFLDALDDLLEPLFHGVIGLFGDDDDAGDDDLSPHGRVNQILNGGNPGPLGPPGTGAGGPLPGGPSALRNLDRGAPAPHLCLANSIHE